MTEHVSGRITYANGAPAQGVRVRVFDTDMRGGDDDLTLQAGLSDADGRYTISYDPDRAADLTTVALDLGPIHIKRTVIDPLDIYLPYLELRYIHFGREHVDRYALTNAQQDLRLPVPPPVGGRFVPSQHGFRFINNFPGSPLPFTIPTIPGLAEIPSYYGLCGGMSALAADFFYARRPIPATREVPSKRTNLYRHLFRRQIDSFSPMGEPIRRFMQWMALDETAFLGCQHRTAEQFAQLEAMFDSGMAVHPIGLVFASPGEALWENHQVLAYGYTEKSASLVEIQIYDPNFPENDQVVVRCDRMTLQGRSSTGEETSFTTMRGRRVARVADALGRPIEQERPMRGFFMMPYAPAPIPPGL